MVNSTGGCVGSRVSRWFLSLSDARQKIESWREDYNQVRPHSSRANLTPEQFVDQHAVSETNLATFTPGVRK